MNILYIALDSLNHSIRICNEIVEKGHTITLVAMDEDYYDNRNIPLHDKRITLIQDTLDNLENPDTFPFHKIKGRYDLIFGSTVRCSAVCNELKKRLKIPWYNMLLDMPTHLIINNADRRELWEKAFLPLLDDADKILVNTNIAKSEYLRIIGKRAKPCEVLTYPTHLPKEFYKSGIGKKGDYVVSVGRLTTTKNFVIIPIAISMLKGINKYVAIGPNKGELYNIKQTCNKYGVEFEHYQDISGKDKMKLIRDSAMMVYPQRTEYIGGLPPYEGMFCGKPVICTQYKVLMDLYKSNALYFIPGSSLELAKNISFVMGMKDGFYKEMGETAAKYAKIEASYEKFANGLINFLEIEEEVNI